MSINSISISGFVAREGKLGKSANNTSYLIFGVGFDDGQKYREGRHEDNINFIDCVIFGDFAKECAPYLTKWRRVHIDGRIHRNRLANTPGKGFQIIVDDITFGIVIDKDGSKGGLR